MALAAARDDDDGEVGWVMQVKVNGRKVSRKGEWQREGKLNSKMRLDGDSQDLLEGRELWM